MKGSPTITWYASLNPSAPPSLSLSLVKGRSYDFKMSRENPPALLTEPQSPFCPVDISPRLVESSGKDNKTTEQPAEPKDATSQRTSGIYSRLLQPFCITLFILPPFLAAFLPAHDITRKLLQESLWDIQRLWDTCGIERYSISNMGYLHHYRPGAVLDLIATQIVPGFWAMTSYASHLREAVSKLLGMLGSAAVHLPVGVPSPLEEFLYFAETAIAGGWALALLAALVASFLISTWTRPSRSVTMLALGLALGVLIGSQYLQGEQVCYVHAATILDKGLRITCGGEYMCSYWNAMMPGINLTTS